MYNQLPLLFEVLLQMEKATFKEIKKYSCLFVYKHLTSYQSMKKTAEKLLFELI